MLEKDVKKRESVWLEGQAEYGSGVVGSGFWCSDAE